MGGAIADTEVHLPAAALRPFISHYAGFRVSGLPAGVHFGLPSSSVDLIVSLGHSIELERTPNSTQAASSFIAFVRGLRDTPAIVRQGSEAFGLHVFIEPLGCRAILGVGGADISSRVVDLSDVWPGRAGRLVEMLRAAGTWERRFAILDRTFAAALKPAGARPEIRWAWSRLAKTHGAVPIQQLADETGYSRRHLCELFRDAAGVTPKLAARIFRFERACRLIADQRLGLADIAMVCGYCDQAHLTREWCAIADCPPKAWIARDLPFLQDYELAGCENRGDDAGSMHQHFV